MIPYKTNNFWKPKSWIKRIFFISLMAYLLISDVVIQIEISTQYKIVFCIVFVLLVIAGQIDELEITDDKIIFSQASLIPFLRTRREYLLDDIDSFKVNEKGILGDSLFLSVLFKTVKEVKISFKNGAYEVISSRLYPGGQENIELYIKNRLKKGKNSE